MHQIRKSLILALLLFTSSAYAQRAVIIQLPSGQMIGVAYTPTGEQVVLTDIRVIKLSDPTPPTPETKGPVWAITIRVAEKLTADQAEVLLNLRKWTDQQPADKVGNLEFPPDAVGPDGAADQRVKGWTSRIPANAKLPYVFISRTAVDGKSSVVHWQGELPTSATELISKMESLMAAKAKK